MTFPARLRHGAAAVFTLACAAAHVGAGAATLIASGLDAPVFLTSPVGDSRLFVVEKAGVIKTLSGSGASTYLDIRSFVDTAGERGLLGLAFDPTFASTGRFYVDYIDKTTHNTVVASFTAPSATATSVNPASARALLTVQQPADRNNHKAGWIGFRSTDPGQLYIATGDGGGAYDPDNRAQNLNDNLGKLLRITPLAAGGYTVPANNPFAGATPGNDEIWAYGLRNPYRPSVDRNTGDLWIADVGQGAREEINVESAHQPGGANYGWRPREGDIATPTLGEPTPPGAVDPVYSYAHGAMGASIIGGYVYRGGQDAALQGRYVFGDFVSGKLFSLQPGTTDVTELASPFGANQLTSFGEDSQGGLYATGLGGDVYRIASGVPEPSTCAMWGLGSLSVGFAAARRRRVQP